MRFVHLTFIKFLYQVIYQSRSLSLCSICFDDTEEVFCTNKRHVLCKSCFENHTMAECDRPEFEGVVQCPLIRMNQCACKGFSTKFIINNVSDKVFEDYERKRDMYKEKILVLKLKKDFEEENKMSQIEKDKKYIIDNILTLRCPRDTCKTAYFDFDGCLSLKCSTCLKHFCGICHLECKDSQSCHQHVLSHVINGRKLTSYFASKETIKIYQNDYRRQKLEEYLKFKSNRKEILGMISKELKDLKLKI